MRPVSARFLRTVRTSHQMDARAFLCTEFQTGSEPTGTELNVTGGVVHMDATADVRSSVDLTVTGIAWPTRRDTTLGPYGNEVFVQRGLKYGNGQTEWVSFGYFQIRELGQDAPPDGAIVLSGMDRMKGIIDSRLLAPRQYLPSDTFGSVVEDLVLDVYPLATIEWDDASDSETLGRSIVTEDDRFATLTDVITSRAKIMYWDHRGVLVIKALPDTTTPVVDIVSGAGGVLVKLARTLSREGVYNAVVATGESSDELPPARGVAVDDNPRSPTYFFGRFGQVPRQYSSPLLSNDVEALAAARTILAKATGLPYNVNLSTVCNPALEPYDPIRVRYGNKQGTEVHVVETLDAPLTAQDAMTGTTREQAL